jgi:undecaprenyl-diphosphatase
MTILQSLILGIVEGLTEFLPVSSTFHLILTSKLLGLAQSDYLKLFEVVIQSGAILSLVFLYLKELLTNRRLFWLVSTAFIPTAILGALLYKVVKSFFFTNLSLQIGVFILVALIFLLLEYLIKMGKLKIGGELKTLSFLQAALIGSSQALAMIPGVSRSGAVLVSMLLMGFGRSSAAHFAFLLSLPTILSASLVDLYQNMPLLVSLTPLELLPLFTGTLAAFISALWVVRWLLRYLASNTLTIFGYIA